MQRLCFQPTGILAPQTYGIGFVVEIWNLHEMN